MSLATQISLLATRVGQEFKQVRTEFANAQNIDGGDPTSVLTVTIDGGTP